MASGDRMGAFLVLTQVIPQVLTKRKTTKLFYKPKNKMVVCNEDYGDSR